MLIKLFSNYTMGVIRVHISLVALFWSPIYRMNIESMERIVIATYYSNKPAYPNFEDRHAYKDCL